MPMPKKAGNVQDSGLTAKQQRELFTMMILATPTDIPRYIYDQWTANPLGLNREVRRILMSPTNKPMVLLALQHDTDTLAQLESWERHYHDEYGMAVDFSGIFIPLRRDGFKRLIVVPQGMTCNFAFAKNASMFPCLAWASDLDTAVKGRNDREPHRHYAIWIRGDVEPDEVFLTAHQARAFGLSCTTLLEDLLMELKYFKETGEHLNKRRITRCDGSRHSDGLVSGVSWYGVDFRVCRFNLSDYPEDNLRPRSVIS